MKLISYFGAIAIALTLSNQINAFSGASLAFKHITEQQTDHLVQTDNNKYKVEQVAQIRPELDRKNQEEINKYRREQGYLDDKYVDQLIENSPDAIKKIIYNFQRSKTHTVQAKKKLKILNGKI